MQTLGRLIDELTIVELKLSHTEHEEKIRTLHRQSTALRAEIDSWVAGVFSGRIPMQDISAPLCKVRARLPRVPEEAGIGELVAELVTTNARMWDNEAERDRLVGISAINELLLNADKLEQQLNQNRSALIELIDTRLKEMLWPSTK